ncbi:MAG: hypothetical protein ACRDRL_16550 [Sciscionella sp.]
MAVQPSKLSPDLQELIARTRAKMEREGEFYPAKGPYESPFDDETRVAIKELLVSGEYRRLADLVAADDPEVADL